MIINLKHFIENEEKSWREFEKMLNLMQNEHKFNLEEVRKFHNLFEKVSDDLLKVSSISGSDDIKIYLEELVASAYSFIYSSNQNKTNFSLKTLIRDSIPQAFRRNLSYFYFALIVTILGGVFGAGVIALSPKYKGVIIPQQFSHLYKSPKERVAEEEKGKSAENLKSHHATFAANLMTHNIKVSFFIFTLGLTFGLGSILLLFYNGVILGAIAFEYLYAGETAFLFGWLLPHGATEISAIMISGQASFIIATALFKPTSKGRFNALKEKRKDISILLILIVILLIWSGIVESFFSQYHEPYLPYYLKITFGTIILISLYLYLFISGRGKGGNDEG
jgi:uncharacterized membrane protein SpoIIM required for sporulation